MKNPEDFISTYNKFDDISAYIENCIQKYTHFAQLTLKSK
jgi:hypothetical protein